MVESGTAGTRLSSAVNTDVTFLWFSIHDSAPRKCLGAHFYVLPWNSEGYDLGNDLWSGGPE